MTKQKLTELLRHAYQWGRDNGSNRSEKNFNDFLQIEAVQQALTITSVVEQSEQLVCEHRWVHNTHSGTKYCSNGCDGFAIHKAN